MHFDRLDEIYAMVKFICILSNLIRPVRPVLWTGLTGPRSRAIFLCEQLPCSIVIEIELDQIYAWKLHNRSNHTPIQWRN
jgi:hypothetical protein